MELVSICVNLNLMFLHNLYKLTVQPPYVLLTFCYVNFTFLPVCVLAAVSGGVWVPAAHHLLRVGLDRNMAAGLQGPASGGRRRKQ